MLDSDTPDEHAFALCTECHGRGFKRAGEFPYVVFNPCAACKGVGQKYLAPKEPKKLSW